MVKVSEVLAEYPYWIGSKRATGEVLNMSFRDIETRIIPEGSAKLLLFLLKNSIFEKMSIVSPSQVFFYKNLTSAKLKKMLEHISGFYLKIGSYKFKPIKSILQKGNRFKIDFSDDVFTETIFIDDIVFSLDYIGVRFLLFLSYQKGKSIILGRDDLIALLGLYPFKKNTHFTVIDKSKRALKALKILKEKRLIKNYKFKIARADFWYFKCKSIDEIIIRK